MATPPSGVNLALLDKLVAALSAKGLVTEAEITERQTITERASPEIGARMVARAWTDPDYYALLMRDGKAAAEAAGASMAGAPELGVLENTPKQHHLVVCTLCSCYPRALLGYPPGWYKSFAYRSRAVREPRAVLAEWGTQIPDDMEIRVVDSTADYRWMVLPMRPKGTEGWSAEKLASIITRDALVGVALPQV
jgi:nitrile hydratase alpha subunit